MPRIEVTIPDHFLFEMTLKVRASDLNYGNHVGHDTILSMMQEARIGLYRSLGYTNELNFDGAVGQVIADVAVQYKSESFLGDELLIKVGVMDFNKYGFDMYYLMLNNLSNKEVARGKTGIVCFNYETRKVATIPQSLKEKLQAFR